MTDPLLDNNNWIWRWCQTPSSMVLHRITKIPREQKRYIIRGGLTTSVCGISRRRFHMPGIFSRMGAPRCKHCCRIVGLPEGEGAPYNNKRFGKVSREK